MSLYVVREPNPYFPLGTYVKRYEDGYEKVELEGTGRATFWHTDSILLPHATLDPFLTKVQKTGLDKGSARQDRRRAEGRSDAAQARRDFVVQEEEAVAEMVDEMIPQRYFRADGS